jgi:hypothetical protein
MSGFLTIAETARELTKKGVAINAQGVYRLLKRGRLPHVKLNRIYVTDIDGFLAESAKASTSQTTDVSVPAAPPVQVPALAKLVMPKKRRFGTPDRDRRSA